MVEHSAVNRRVASSNLARGANLLLFFLTRIQTDNKTPRPYPPWDVVLAHSSTYSVLTTLFLAGKSLRYSSWRQRAFERVLLCFAFLLDKCRTCGILTMKTYSVSEAARVLGVDRRTLQRWVREKRIPAPTAGVVRGVLLKFWTEKDMTTVREYKAARYWGKGIDRRTGRKAKHQGS
jgi:excisionase family DNA binding protein